MAEVGSAFVSILPSAKGFGSKLSSEVGGEVDGAGKKVGSRFGSALKVGAFAAVGGALLAGKFVKDSVASLQRIEKINTQTATVIKSTGGAANVSAGHVERLAGRMENLTAMEAESVQEGANLLLTFTNIQNEVGKGNKIFDRATTSLVDMSTAMGTDPKNAAIQLGKALNDPIKGVTSLGRAGVQFTEGQKEQIKTLVESGNTMKAQKIILAELETQFGGSGEAFAKTTQGKIELAKHAIGTLGETLTAGLLPILGNLASGLSTTLNAISANVGPVFARIAAVVGPVFGQVRAAVQGVIASFGGGGGGLMAAFQQVGAFITSSVVPAFMGIVAAVRGFVAVALPIVQQFVAGMRARIEPMLPLIKQVFTQIGSVVTGAMNLVKTVIQAATAIIKAVWSRWGSDIMNAIATIFKNVVTVISGALKVIQGVIKTVTSIIKGDWSGAWDGIKMIVSGVWTAIKGIVSLGINAVKAVLSGAAGVLKAAMAAAWDAVKSAVSNGIDNAVAAARSLPGRIVSALGSLGSLLFSKGAELIQGLINGIMSKLGAVGDAIGNVAGKIKGFLPGSPVKEGPLKSWNNGAAGKRLVSMLAEGMDAGGPLLTAASTRMASRVASPAVSHGNVSRGASLADLAAEMQAVRATLERMPKAYQLGARQGAF